MEFKDVASLNFELALAELEKVVKLLENGISLEDMIKYHEYATELQRYLKTTLENAKLRLKTIDTESVNS